MSSSESMVVTKSSTAGSLVFLPSSFGAGETDSVCCDFLDLAISRDAAEVLRRTEGSEQSSAARVFAAGRATLRKSFEDALAGRLTSAPRRGVVWEEPQRRGGRECREGHRGEEHQYSRACGEDARGTETAGRPCIGMPTESSISEI